MLDVQGLSLSFQFRKETFPVVTDVSLELNRGEILGLVGESGCGKSITALSLTRLLPSPPGYIDRGRVLFNGKDLLTLSERELQSFRGSKISMVFQEPMTALNPVFSVGDQIAEVVQVHENKSKKESLDRAIEMMEQVGIPSAQKRASYHPHQLSGGLRQRAMIAMALVCKPSILIADEPTTALDVTIQAQILELIENLQRQNDMGVLLITHDLGVVAELANRVAVMYAGEIVEMARVERIYSASKHPYTIALQNALPGLAERISKDRLPTIEGRVPPPDQVSKHCRFFDRCKEATSECTKEHPSLREVEHGHWVRCIRA